MLCMADFIRHKNVDHKEMYDVSLLYHDMMGPCQNCPVHIVQKFDYVGVGGKISAAVNFSQSWTGKPYRFSE